MVLGSVRVDCNAKINLYLRILSKRDDGYHNIETLFHSICLHDTLGLRAADSGISVVCNDDMVPLDGSNTAVRAARTILKKTGRGLRIRIDKRIPVGSGLGGGSADAAGVLVGVNLLYGLGFSVSDLEQMAAGVGADVAFLVRGGCAVGRDRGERLEHLKPLPAMPVLLVVPQLSISTAWAYGSYKIELTRDKGRLSMVTSALGGRDSSSLFGLLENGFESVVFEKYPLVKELKEDLIGYGARAALMTGSGPVVFGLFEKEGDAEACKGRFQDRGHRAVLSRLADSGVTVTQ
jgi:4-diphosphocytidyl-2-C-methyl-D-erythritol kinase